MKKKPTISIVIPCYNEELRIKKTLLSIISFLNKEKINAEIIVVDDGSKDNTGAIADRLAKRNKKIIVIHHKKNCGYGAALKSGFNCCNKDLIFYTDGDGQFDIREIKKLLPLIKRYDIVTGYRLKRQDNLVRKWNGFMWTQLINLLFGLRLKDIDCAFKLYKKEIFENIKIESESAFIDAEILIKAYRKGYSIGEIGVHHFPRKAGKQTGSDIKVIIKAFKELYLFLRGEK